MKRMYAVVLMLGPVSLFAQSEPVPPKCTHWIGCSACGGNPAGSVRQYQRSCTAACVNDAGVAIVRQAHPEDDSCAKTSGLGNVNISGLWKDVGGGGGRFRLEQVGGFLTVTGTSGDGRGWFTNPYKFNM